MLRGDGGRDEFAAHLRAAGAAVHFAQAYQRGPARPTASRAPAARPALAAPEQHLWWLSSAEAIGYLPQLAPGRRLARRAALASHPRIAARARELGFGHVFEAPPTVDAVCASVAQIEACYNRRSP